MFCIRKDFVPVILSTDRDSQSNQLDATNVRIYSPSIKANRTRKEERLRLYASLTCLCICSEKNPLILSLVQPTVGVNTSFRAF